MIWGISMIMGSDYIDEDVAYLLGLIVARGEVDPGEYRITITFPFKNLSVKGISKGEEYNVPRHLTAAVSDIAYRLSELLEHPPAVKGLDNEVIMEIKFSRRNLIWRDLMLLLNNKHSHYEFHIPKQMFDTDDKNIKKEFIRGYADVAGHVRTSNRDQNNRHRVYLDVLNSNWHLPIELCKLLQDHLNVPVQSIAWGHPNIRDPRLKDYRKGKHHTWAREHQIKIYAEAFEKIGFYLTHKQEILEELASYNKTKFRGRHPHFCNPPKQIRQKQRHPEENSEKLPPKIRGKHYDAYWQICCDLECPRCKRKEDSNSNLKEWLEEGKS